jgi:glycosyltransferase involved in cell wall biosynthesis
VKIIQLIYALGPGGAERLVLDLCNETAKTEEVTLLTIFDYGEITESYLLELSENVKIINLKRKGNKLLTLFKIFIVINKLKPEIVHAHLNTIIYLFLPSLFLKKIKFFHTLHSIATKDVELKMQKKVNSFFYKRKFIQPITISDQVKLSFFEYYKFDNSILIQNGRKKLFKTEYYEKTKLEVKKLKNHPDDVVFVHPSRYCESKNQKMLISVFNKLLKENYHLILLIIGPSFDNEEAMELRNDIEKGIHFLGVRTNIGDYLYCSDAFCLSSLWEGLPISLIEALSCGVIPICTPAGGIPDVIADGKNGYLSEDFTLESYFAAIVRYLENKDAIDRNSLIDLFMNNFSIEICGSKHIQAYKSVINTD